MPLWLGEGGIIDVQNLQQQVHAQKEVAHKLSTRNKMLEAEVKDLKNRLEALEERARTDLGMIKDKESFYQSFSN